MTELSASGVISGDMSEDSSDNSFVSFGDPSPSPQQPTNKHRTKKLSPEYTPPKNPLSNPVLASTSSAPPMTGSTTASAASSSATAVSIQNGRLPPPHHSHSHSHNSHNSHSNTKLKNMSGGGGAEHIHGSTSDVLKPTDFSHKLQLHNNKSHSHSKSSTSPSPLPPPVRSGSSRGAGAGGGGGRGGLPGLPGGLPGPLTHSHSHNPMSSGKGGPRLPPLSTTLTPAYSAAVPPTSTHHGTESPMDDDSLNMGGISKKPNPNQPQSRSAFDLTKHRGDASNGVVLLPPWANKITEPRQIDVRGASYLTDGIKISSGPIHLPLVGIECWSCPDRIDHIVSKPYKTWYSEHIDPDDDSIFVVIMHLQVPSIGATFIQYHVLEGGLPARTNDDVFNKMFTRIIDGSEEYRKARLKIIPKVISGPFAVQHMVKNRPCILGNRVTHRYFRGRNYFEIDAHVDDSYLSASIIKLCHKLSTRIIVDMSWVIEGQSENELPERAMIGCTINNLDFTKIKPIEELSTKEISQDEQDEQEQDEEKTE